MGDFYFLLSSFWKYIKALLNMSNRSWKKVTKSYDLQGLLTYYIARMYHIFLKEEKIYVISTRVTKQNCLTFLLEWFWFHAYLNLKCDSEVHKDWFIKNWTKLTSVLLLCLIRFFKVQLFWEKLYFMNQSLEYIFVL